MRARVVIVVVAVIAAIVGALGFALWLVNNDAAPVADAAAPRGDDVADAFVDAGTPQIATAPVDAHADADADAGAARASAAPIDDGRGRLDIVVVDRRGAPVDAYALLVLPNAPDSPRDFIGKYDRKNAVERDVHDRDGRATVDIAPGPASISVVAKGYRKHTDERVTVIAGAAASVRIVLDASNALRGTVHDAETRKPIAGATIDVEGEDVQSDAEGRFVVLTLPDARFSIRASADGYQSLDIGGIRGDRSRDEAIDVELDPLSDGGPEREFVGVGFMMGPNGEDGAPVVAEVFPDTPAAALLQAGDVITAIDGTDTTHMPAPEARELIRGDVGGSVRIDVLRDGKPLRFDVDRARIPMRDQKRPRPRRR